MVEEMTPASNTPRVLLINGRPHLLDRRVELMRWLRWKLPAHHVLIHWALT